jgi:hypothetical protein
MMAPRCITSLVRARIDVIAVQRRAGNTTASSRIAVLRTVAGVAVVIADHWRTRNTTGTARITALRTVAGVAVIIAHYRSVLASALAEMSSISRIRENLRGAVTTIIRARIAIVTSSHWVRKGETASSSEGITGAVVDYTGPSHTSRD